MVCAAVVLVLLLSSGMLLWFSETHWCAEGMPLLSAGKNGDLIALITWRGQDGLSRPAARELWLDISLSAQWQVAARRWKVSASDAAPPS
jgi:hypothetical protein